MPFIDSPTDLSAIFVPRIASWISSFNIVLTPSLTYHLPDSLSLGVILAERRIDVDTVISNGKKTIGIRYEGKHDASADHVNIQTLAKHIKCVCFTEERETDMATPLTGPGRSWQSLDRQTSKWTVPRVVYNISAQQIWHIILRLFCYVKYKRG